MEIIVDISREIKNVEDLFFLIDSLKETKPQMEQKKRGGRYEEWQSPNTKPEETDKEPWAGSGQTPGCKEHGGIFRGCQPDSTKKAGFIWNETKDEETDQGGKGMKVEIGILEKELDAITCMGTVKEIMNGTTKNSDVLNDLETVCLLLERIFMVAENKQIIQKNKFQARKIEEAKIPPKQRVLSDQEKIGLKNEEIFMKEYGLFTSFVADHYWSSVFKRIYGYSPSLL